MWCSFECRLEIHLLTSWTDCASKVKSLFFDHIASVCNAIANTLVCVTILLAAKIVSRCHLERPIDVINVKKL